MQGALSEGSRHRQVPKVGQQLRRPRFQNSLELQEVPSTELGLSAGRPLLLPFGVDLRMSYQWAVGKRMKQSRSQGFGQFTPLDPLILF